MSWICNKCNHSNPNVGEYCYFCIHHVGIKVLRSGQDFYDESEHRQVLFEIYKTEKAENLDFHHFDYVKNWRIPVAEMSAKEQLFANFFNNEKGLVKDMDDIKLKAHIEELQDIAFQARARLSAADDEARERAATRKKNKGFQASVQTDDFTSNAIHNINERQKKMSKQEKEIERLVGLGIDRAVAENMYKAKTVLAVKEHGAQSVIVDQIVSETPTGAKAFSNPFSARKPEELKPSAELQSALDSILNPQTVVIEDKPLVNPFASASKPETPPVPAIEIPPDKPVEAEGLTKDFSRVEIAQAESRISREVIETKVEILDSPAKVDESLKESLEKKAFNPFAKKG